MPRAYVTERDARLLGVFMRDATPSAAHAVRAALSISAEPRNVAPTKAGRRRQSICHFLLTHTRRTEEART